MPEKSQSWLRQYESNRLVKKVNFINLQNIAKIQKNRKFNFRIPDEKEVFTAVGKHIKYRDDYNYHWSGSIVNQEKKYSGEIQITWKEGKVFGEVNVKGRHFTIENLNGDEDKAVRNPIHVLVEKEVHILDQMRCGVGHSKEEKGDSITQSEIPLESRSICPKIVRIMVLYTPATANAVPNINAYIDQKWEELERILNNSRVNSFMVQLAYSGLTTQINDQVNIGGNGYQTSVNILTQLENNSNIENLRNQYHADLVALLVDNSVMLADNNYGVASEVFQPNSYNRNNAFSVTHYNHTGRYTFAHEIAHNFGCHHDEGPPTQDDPTSKGWARGKNLPLINKKTVMGDIGVSGERLDYLSNPSLNIPTEELTGISVGPNDDIKLGDHQSRQNAQHMDSTGKWIIWGYNLGGETFQASILGTGHIHSNINFTWCPNITCGWNPPFNYHWQWSPNGMNSFATLSNSECVTFNSSSLNLSSSQYITLRLTITGNGINFTTDYPIFVNLDINARKMPTSPIQHEFTKISTLANVYPIPSEGNITIELSTLEDVNLTIELYNQDGSLEKVIEKDKAAKKGKHILQIENSSMKSGIKFIRIYDGVNVMMLPTIIK